MNSPRQEEIMTNSAPGGAIDYNTKIIEEFRASQGRVGGMWAGTTLILIHHIGAKSGIERVTPLAGRRRSSKCSGAMSDRLLGAPMLAAATSGRVRVGGAVRPMLRTSGPKQNAVPDRGLPGCVTARRERTLSRYAPRYTRGPR